MLMTAAAEHNNINVSLVRWQQQALRFLRLKVAIILQIFTPTPPFFAVPVAAVAFAACCKTYPQTGVFDNRRKSVGGSVCGLFSHGRSRR
jgi:hypothetical protein